MKLADGLMVQTAMDAVRGTGLLPRDVLMRAISNGFYDIHNEGGEVLTYRQNFVEPKTFQGLITYPGQNFTSANNVNTAMTYGLPVLNTAGMWDPGATDRFTIPEKVQVISIYAGFGFNAVQPVDARLWIRKAPNNPALALQSQALGFYGQGINVGLGGLVVNQGEQYQIIYTVNTAKTVRAALCPLVVSIDEVV